MARIVVEENPGTSIFFFAYSVFICFLFLFDIDLHVAKQLSRVLSITLTAVL